MNPVEIKTDAEGKRRMDMVREQIRENNLARIKQDNPGMLEWFDQQPIDNDGDIHALIETIGYNPWHHRNDDCDATDTGPWGTRWYDAVPHEEGLSSLQLIWHNCGTGALMLFDEDERDDFTVLMQSKLSEPDWDRGTYDAYEHARSKDD